MFQKPITSSPLPLNPSRPHEFRRFCKVAKRLCGSERWPNYHPCLYRSSFAGLGFNGCYSYLYIYIYTYIYIYIYIYTIPVLGSPTPPPPQWYPPPPPQPCPSRICVTDCAHVFHMRAPKATTVTRIASRCPIRVTVHIFQARLSREGAKAKAINCHEDRVSCDCRHFRKRTPT